MIKINKIFTFCGGLVLWLPYLILGVFDDTSDEFGAIGAAFIALGIVLPIMIFFALKTDLSVWRYPVGLSVYFVTGLIAHFFIKKEWGEGII